MEPDKPSNEHLGTAWEIAIVVVFVVILFAILAATVFQIRRRQRQKRRRELGTDIENDKTPKRKTRAQDKRRRTDSVTTIHEIVQKHSHPVGVREDRSTEEIQKPSPSFQLKQTNDSLYNEYLSKKPPNYYWEERFH